jgi:hypothetical protein
MGILSIAVGVPCAAPRRVASIDRGSEIVGEADHLGILTDKSNGPSASTVNTSHWVNGYSVSQTILTCVPDFVGVRTLIVPRSACAMPF